MLHSLYLARIDPWKVGLSVAFVQLEQRVSRFSLLLRSFVALKIRSLQSRGKVKLKYLRVQQNRSFQAPPLVHRLAWAHQHLNLSASLLLTPYLLEAHSIDVGCQEHCSCIVRTTAALFWIDIVKYSSRSRASSTETQHASIHVYPPFQALHPFIHS